MRLSWNEIKVRASKFSEEWKHAHYEKGETQTFYNEFFQIFGVTRRRVATFEEHVKLLDNRSGFIDLFWKGVLLVEQKSAGRDLTKAKGQALEYFEGLKDSDLPRYVLVSDFQTFKLHDLEEGTTHAFKLAELAEHIELFGFVIGVEKRSFKDQDPVNVQASGLMARLHDALDDSGYSGHDLERFLVRLLFCLFADDTGIFEPRDIFLDLITTRMREDGSDTGAWLANLFEVLNTPPEKRQKKLDEDLARFPYVNGDLFAERLPIPSFDAKMRGLLLEACEFSWDAISPAIFGSLFQSVMNRKQRREKGAHYTSEKNILKVISSLFLDDTRAEFERIKALKSGRTARLERFHESLSSLTFLDPACGSGNFLILAYRELRLLELELLRELNPKGQMVLDVTALSRVNVDQFYGFEIEEFPARIAEVSMWMMDHIMNNRLSLEFGEVYARIPLKASPHIRCGNALQEKWEDLLPAAKCSYILGNPPFIGHQWRTADQQRDMHAVWGRAGQVNRLDYVTCWFRKAAQYAAVNKAIKIAFVSTNSITQGEQVSILWPTLFAEGLSIFFAHRTFQWTSEARGTAAVHCVIIGLMFGQPAARQIFEYKTLRGEPHVASVLRINGYLVDGPQYSVPARTQPQPGMLKLHKGSQPTDGARLKKPGGGYVTTSNLILTAEDKAQLLKEEPRAGKWLRPYVGGDELISGQWRWCLWLKDADPKAVRASQALAPRLKRVRDGRLASPTASVRDYAKYPTLFTQDRQPSVAYMAVPEVSSETREYLPITKLPPEVIASNKLMIVPGAPPHYYAIMSSAMHMAWMRVVGGRLKSDYSYSPAIYNSFPWPDLTDKNEKALAALWQDIIDTRASFPSSQLEDLYDPDSMPPKLRKAHEKLDTAVDRLYRTKPFAFERERVEFLFSLYEKIASPIEAASKKGKRKTVA